MSIVVSFIDFIPPERFDDNPWTGVRIEEAPTEDGTWTVIDNLTLTPVDADPSDPASRSFTTSNGTADDLWYRVTFTDDSIGESEPSTPQQNVAPGLGTPYATVEELARILKVDAEAREDALHRVLAAAAYEIDAEVGNTSPYLNPPPLAVEVNLERAVEHWQQMQSPFGLVGVGGVESPAFSSSNSWERHAVKLAPLKVSWGIA